MSDRMRTVGVRMPAELWEAIKAKAAKDERSAAQEMRWTLKLWVRNSSPIPEDTQ